MRTPHLRAPGETHVESHVRSPPVPGTWRGACGSGPRGVAAWGGGTRVQAEGVRWPDAAAAPLSGTDGSLPESLLGHHPTNPQLWGAALAPHRTSHEFIDFNIHEFRN